MPYRTTPKMARRKEQRRARLLSTAIRLFAEHGYHATTVPMIVAAAESSTGSFYFYFRNKEDIFAAALEDFGARIAAALNEAIAHARGPLAQMRAAVERFVLLLAENPAEARVLIVESSGLGGRLHSIRRAVIESHTRSVEKALGQLRPDLARAEISILARCWVGAVLESVCYYLTQPSRRRPNAATLAAAVAGYNLRATRNY